MDPAGVPGTYTGVPGTIYKKEKKFKIFKPCFILIV